MNFEFSSLIIPINNKTKGLFRFSIEPKIKILELGIEIHKLLFDVTDEKLVNTLMKSITDKCDINPLNNDSIFNSISTKILAKRVFNYYELEDLSNKFKFINAYDDLNEKLDLPGNIFGIVANFPVRDIRRMQRYIDSFLFNYQILLDTIRYVESRNDIKINEIQKDEKLIVDDAPPKNDNVVIEKLNSIDEILEFLIISPHVFSYLIHLIFDYYRYFKLSEIISMKDGNIEMHFNNIFPNTISINRGYVHGLLECIECVSLEKINLLTKNIIKYINNFYDKLNNIEIQSCINILFWFSLRHLMETHKTWIYQNIIEVFTSNEFQSKLLNKYIPKITGFNITFKNMQSDILIPDESNVEQIIKKYEYLKTMDQEKFADFVYNDYESRNQENIKIGGIKTIINIENFIGKKYEPTNFIKNTFAYDGPLLLKYEKSKTLTPVFDTFLKYLENPLAIMDKKNQEIPLNVLNSFEKLKSILNDANFSKENISTLNYYIKLKDIMVDDFPFQDYLYIIFQLIIPYMYYFHNLTRFEDNFLQTVRL